MVVSLAGPTWSRLPVPTYHRTQPKILVLDLSSDMAETDIKPSRLARAKFKIHDLLHQKHAGQFGLIVYTSEPFVVSPLTEDAQTVEELLPALVPNIMPVNGNNLQKALQEAETLIKQAGLEYGQVLVFTGQAPSDMAIQEAQRLRKNHMSVSIMPVRETNELNSSFAIFAAKGGGQLIPFTETQTNFQAWLKQAHENQYTQNSQQDMPIWHDQGRWFIIPALMFLLPAFQRGWLQRIRS